MERNSLSADLKHHSICAGRPMKENNIIRFKNSWDTSNINNHDSLGGDLLAGYSWPPRSYTCTFCKREFRSAQALGGHMNVHRRDRARLRQSPPRSDCQFYSGNMLNLNLDPHPSPNPSPNFSSSSQPSSPTAMFHPLASSKLPSVLSPSISSLSSPSSVSGGEILEWGSADNVGVPTHHSCSTSANLAKLKSRKSLLGIGGFDGLNSGKECKIIKKAEIVRLNLEIGLLSESRVEDIDLELRLGCS